MDETLNLIESVSEGFPSYFFLNVENLSTRNKELENTIQNVTEKLICSKIALKREMILHIFLKLPR